MKKKALPYGKQLIDARDAAGVAAVLRSDRLTQGPKVAEFEEKLAAYTGAKYALAMANGTAALHLAYLACGVGPGEDVLTTPMTFAATTNGFLYCGARPVFSDVSSDTLNLEPELLGKKLTARTAAIAPVDFGGHPAEMAAIAALAQKKKLAVVEDACHALGARYRSGSSWKRVGDAAFADACVFSFHPVKAITTGEGGAVTTNRRDVYEKMRLLRSHGMVKARPEEPWHYEIASLGFNYRITDMQCALGISQLTKLNAFTARRREIARRYNEAFKSFSLLRVPAERSGFESAYHLYPIRLELERLSAGRAEVFRALHREGLLVQVHYVPLHTQPLYKEYRGKAGDLPAAEDYYSRAVSLPIFPAMTAADLCRSIATVKKVLHSFERKR